MRTEDHGFKFAGTVQVRNRREKDSGRTEESRVR